QYWLFLYCCPSVCCVMGFGITSVLAFSLLLSICLLCNGIWYKGVSSALEEVYLPQQEVGRGY
ncbi:MAG: hypothetical protein ACR5K9_07960, partial [Wolbachia sp.]